MLCLVQSGPDFSSFLTLLPFLTLTLILILALGVATFTHEYIIDVPDEEYQHLMTLAGIISALGCLMPSPLLGAKE